MSYVPPTPEYDWEDLAQNRPGDSLRRAGDERRKAAPAKSLIGRLFGVKSGDKAFRIGAEGEEAVGAKLDSLGLGFYTLHSVPVGNNNSDLDHLVVGPKGVVVVNTKNHPGGKITVGEKVIWVNGDASDYLRNSRYEAKRASGILSKACGFEVKVRPIIVVANGDLTFRGNSRPKDVEVLGIRDVIKRLRAGRTVLDINAVSHIFGVARRSTTWQPKTRNS